jgi:hypothetical protein
MSGPVKKNPALDILNIIDEKPVIFLCGLTPQDHATHPPISQGGSLHIHVHVKISTFISSLNDADFARPAKIPWLLWGKMT